MRTTGRSGEAPSPDVMRPCGAAGWEELLPKKAAEIPSMWAECFFFFFYQQFWYALRG
jgi:hypothetical protein